jgi:tetratricopeptide (TPR) repeat protein
VGEEAEPLVPGQQAKLRLPSADGTPPTTEADSLVGLIGPGTPPNVAAALRLVEDGRRHLEAGDHDQALDRFERSVAIDPASPYGYYFLAQLYYLKKNYDQAAAFANRAGVLSTRANRVWLGRVYSLQGAVFEEVGRFPDARNAYHKAVEADPNNLAARIGATRLEQPR